MPVPPIVAQQRLCRVRFGMPGHTSDQTACAVCLGFLQCVCAFWSAGTDTVIMAKVLWLS